MKIIGIEPRAPGLHIFSQTRMPRLGLPQLLTIAQLMGHQCRIYCEDIAPIDWADVRQAVMLEAMPKAYNLWQTVKIFMANGFRIALDFVDSLRQHRRWHPFHDARRNALTLLLRIGGKITINRTKKSAKQYARQLPS